MTTILPLLMCVMMLVFVTPMAKADSEKDINEAALKRSMDVAHQMKEAKINELEKRLKDEEKREEKRLKDEEKREEKRLKTEEKLDDVILTKRFSGKGGDVLQIVAKQAYEIADLKRAMEKTNEKTKREMKSMKKTEEETTKTISELQQEVKKLKASRQKVQPRQDADPVAPLEQWIDSANIELKDLSKRVTKLEGTAENCFVFVGGKNWTLIQRRRSITKNPWNEAKWNDYKTGFGNPSAENFWLGLEKMHDMTAKGKWQLMVRMKLTGGPHTGQMGFAFWEGFKVGPESDLYRLTVGPRIEIVNIDSPTDYLKDHNGQQFSTSDKGPAPSGAVAYFGGWWYLGDNGFYICLNCHYDPRGQGFGLFFKNGARVYVSTTEIGIREHN